MPKFTSELVDDLAKKLLFELSPEENKMVLDEFAIIDANLSKVEKIGGLKEIEPMTHTLDDFSVTLRKDEANESVLIEDALRNCSQVVDREIEVPIVVGGEN